MPRCARRETPAPAYPQATPRLPCGPCVGKRYLFALPCIEPLEERSMLAASFPLQQLAGVGQDAPIGILPSDGSTAVFRELQAVAPSLGSLPVRLDPHLGLTEESF